MAFSTKLWGHKALCLWYSNVQHEQEGFSSRSCPWSSAGGHPAVVRGKLQHRSRTLSMTWELIWIWEKKNPPSLGRMQRWKMLRAAESGLENAWTAKGWSITVGETWADPSTFPNSLCSLHVSPLDPNDWEKSSRWLHDFRCGGHTFILTFEQGIWFAFFSRRYSRTDNLRQARFWIFSWFLFEKLLFFPQIWSLPSSELGHPSIVIALILLSDGCSCDSQTQRKESHNV